jgi:hypothetical protein
VMPEPQLSESLVRVCWLDSCMLHGQVDVPDLPTPSRLETVGWLSFEGPDHIVVSRDRSPDPGSYTWRSSVAIPRSHIIGEIGFLAEVDRPVAGTHSPSGARPMTHRQPPLTPIEEARDA